MFSKWKYKESEQGKLGYQCASIAFGCKTENVNASEKRDSVLPERHSVCPRHLENIVLTLFCWTLRFTLSYSISSSTCISLLSLSPFAIFLCTALSSICFSLASAPFHRLPFRLHAWQWLGPAVNLRKHSHPPQSWSERKRESRKTAMEDNER